VPSPRPLKATATRVRWPVHRSLTARLDDTGALGHRSAQPPSRHPLSGVVAESPFKALPTSSLPRARMVAVRVSGLYPDTQVDRAIAASELPGEGSTSPSPGAMARTAW
jgi:hypothetical protein